MSYRSGVRFPAGPKPLRKGGEVIARWNDIPARSSGTPCNIRPWWILLQFADSLQGGKAEPILIQNRESG